MFRIIANFLLLFFILFFPWWLSAIFAVASLLYFRRFYEILAWAIVFDLLYGTRVTAFYHFQFLATAGAIIFFAADTYVKSKIRL